MNRRIQISAIMCASAIVITSLGSPFASEAYAETCVGPGPQICVDFLDAGDPLFPNHFDVDFTDPDNPDVVLKLGSLSWQVRSRVGPPPNDTPANIGDITLNPAVNTDDFGVKLANGTGAGAVDVGSIVLDDVGFTGSSSIAAGSKISGDLGGLTLVGNGGVLDGLIVLGNLTGPLTVPTVKGESNRISLNVIGDADITIGKIEYGGFTIDFSLVCDGGVCPDITVTDKIYDGFLVVGVDVPSGSTIKIEELEDADPATGITEVNVSDGGDFAGTLDLPKGLANPDTKIDMGGLFIGVIDLHGGGVGLNAEIAVYAATTTAVIKDGGTVSGDVYLSFNIPGQDLKYEGTATFASVSSTGEIATQTISPPAHFGGILTVTGTVTGLIEILGSHLVGAEINIGGSLSGDILILGDMSGDVTITNDQSGYLKIDEDLSGTVTMGGALANGLFVGGGRIMVGGESSGPIKVGKKTGSLTLIHLAGGLGLGGTIEINTTRGNFNAEGDIHIGPKHTPVALPFDGCIRIYDFIGLPAGGGALDGDITVVGCHDPGGETLVICIDGPVNGNVNLVQTGCDGEDATWGCGGPLQCP